MFTLSASTRLRRSPFHEATLEEGVTAFTVYNRMLMPTGYGDREAEYRRLIEGVALWDVAVERQVQMRGPDAARLAQLLVPRDLSGLREGRGRYVPLCDHGGRLINDPVLLKLAPDRWWLSIADSDAGLWARAVAAERGLDVVVDEPDVSPLAVQGPLAVELVSAVFGDWTRELGRFAFREAEVEGIPVVVARSGWSGQGGFEVYLMDGAEGVRLWRLLREAGRPWDVGPGYPDPCERIESGLLSFGGDTDEATDPFEAGLGRYVDLDMPHRAIGLEALRRIHERGPRRHRLGVALEPDEAPPDARWHEIRRDGRGVGAMTAAARSPRLGRVIGFALVSRECGPGEPVAVRIEGRDVPGTLTALPFL